ncbi:MAG: hypothetical protein OXC13_05620 [Caldilineaceae bacterium]|nr:hypothetical protein [Caldilineaceae bacterium]
MTTLNACEILLTLRPEQSRVLDRFLEAWGPPVWIVGGMVRDRLLELAPGHDLDLVVPRSNQLEDQHWVPGDWRAFCLDPRRQIWRLASHPPSKREPVGTIDLVVLGGSRIEADLGQRDFRVNAMAVRVKSVVGTQVTGTLVDPFGGRVDLAQRTVVPVSERNMLSDPLRMLRGVRLSHGHGLMLSAELRSFIGQHGPLAGQAARERVGPEVWKLVTSPASSIREVAHDLNEMNLWPLVADREGGPFILSEDDMLWLSRLQAWTRSTKPGRGQCERSPGPMAPDIDAVIDLRQMARAYLGPGRMRGDWWVMAAVLWLILPNATAARPSAGMQRWARRCAFASAEQQWLGSVGAALDHVWRQWVHPPDRGRAREPTVIDCHRLMEKTGWYLGRPALQDACAIAAPLARTTGAGAQTRLTAIQHAVNRLWRLGQGRPVQPLATGRDLLNWYALAPGPEVGRLLTLLVEAQVTGRVTSPAEARVFLDGLLYHRSATDPFQGPNTSRPQRRTCNGTS